ncbi:MAG: hypothetical protein JO121_29030 [Deltaproteobacteria bacterium]|nr:hypothetical protein [Deltaproteobacteria bacterium]
MALFLQECLKGGENRHHLQVVTDGLLVNFCFLTTWNLQPGGQKVVFFEPGVRVDQHYVAGLADRAREVKRGRYRVTIVSHQDFIGRVVAGTG